MDFEGTVRENLVYCTEGVSDEKVKEACRAVGLDHFIKTLSHGYDTILNDQVNLSQGQKQQLTIARAMIADKPMLILDEATSSVDTRTELQIQDAMDKLMADRTSFVIAHRLSTIKNADLILVMKDGDIIEKVHMKNFLQRKASMQIFITASLNRLHKKRKGARLCTNMLQLKENTEVQEQKLQQNLQKNVKSHATAEKFLRSFQERQECLLRSLNSMKRMPQEVFCIHYM